MPPQPIKENSQFIDLSARFQQYSTVDASPAAGAETVIATLTLSGFNDLAVVSGIQLVGWAAFTVGTNGVSANLRIRRTDVNGTVKAATGLVTETAANLAELSCFGFDATPQE